jgi:hypothetical protein
MESHAAAVNDTGNNATATPSMQSLAVALTICSAAEEQGNEFHANDHSGVHLAVESRF